MASPDPVLAAARRRVVLEAPQRTPDGAGGHAESFTTLAAVWAEVRWTGGRARRRADRAEQQADWRVTMRFREDVSGAVRIRLGARILQVLSAGDPDGRRRHLVCLCEEIAP